MKACSAQETLPLILIAKTGLAFVLFTIITLNLTYFSPFLRNGVLSISLSQRLSLSLSLSLSLILSPPLLCECVLTFSHTSAPQMTEIVVAVRGEVR